MGRKLFVGNLSFETSDADLQEAFSKAGTCTSAMVIKDRMSGRSRGFGFVEMGSEEEAQRAIADLNGKEVRGRTMNVSEARERSESRPAPRPGGSRDFPPRTESGGGGFRKEGGSRRGIRARKRSL